MIYGDQKLRLEIDATNRVNELANRLYEKLVPIFRPLVGQKVVNADKHLSDRVKKKLPDLPGGPGVHCYYYASDYTVNWSLRVTAHDPNNDNAHADATAGVYVGELRDGVLTKIMERDKPLRTDYTFDQIKAARVKTAEAKKVYEAAKDECSPFGEG